VQRIQHWAQSPTSRDWLRGRSRSSPVAPICLCVIGVLICIKA